MSTPYITTFLQVLTDGIDSCKNLNSFLEEFNDDLPHLEGDFIANQVATLTFNARQSLFSTIAKLSILANELERNNENG